MSNDLIKAMNKAGLVAKKVQVTRNGKTFMQTVYVNNAPDTPAVEKKAGKPVDAEIALPSTSTTSTQWIEDKISSLRGKIERNKRDMVGENKPTRTRLSDKNWGYEKEIRELEAKLAKITATDSGSREIANMTPEQRGLNTMLEVLEENRAKDVAELEQLHRDGDKSIGGSKTAELKRKIASWDDGIRDVKNRMSGKKTIPAYNFSDYKAALAVTDNAKANEVAAEAAYKKAEEETRAVQDKFWDRDASKPLTDAEKESIKEDIRTHEKAERELREAYYQSRKDVSTAEETTEKMLSDVLYNIKAGDTFMMGDEYTVSAEKIEVGTRKYLCHVIRDKYGEIVDDLSTRLKDDGTLADDELSRSSHWSAARMMRQLEYISNATVNEQGATAIKTVYEGGNLPESTRAQLAGGATLGAFPKTTAKASLTEETPLKDVVKENMGNPQYDKDPDETDRKMQNALRQIPMERLQALKAGYANRREVLITHLANPTVSDTFSLGNEDAEQPRLLHAINYMSWAEGHIDTAIANHGHILYNRPQSIVKVIPKGKQVSKDDIVFELRREGEAVETTGGYIEQISGGYRVTDKATGKIQEFTARGYKQAAHEQVRVDARRAINELKDQVVELDTPAKRSEERAAVSTMAAHLDAFETEQKGKYEDAKTKIAGDAEAYKSAGTSVEEELKRLDMGWNSQWQKIASRRKVIEDKMIALDKADAKDPSGKTLSEAMKGNDNADTGTSVVDRGGLSIAPAHMRDLPIWGAVKNNGGTVTREGNKIWKIDYSDDTSTTLECDPKTFSMSPGKSAERDALAEALKKLNRTNYATNDTPAPPINGVDGESTVTNEAEAATNNNGANGWSFDKFQGMKGNKAEALQYLKDSGVTWTEHAAENINWMRATMAAKKHNGGAITPIAEPKTDNNDNLSKLVGERDKTAAMVSKYTEAVAAIPKGKATGATGRILREQQAKLDKLNAEIAEATSKTLSVDDISGFGGAPVKHKDVTVDGKTVTISAPIRKEYYTMRRTSAAGEPIKTGFIEVTNAKPVPNNHGLELFSYKPDGTSKRYIVEATTGLKIVDQTTGDNVGQPAIKKLEDIDEWLNSTSKGGNKQIDNINAILSTITDGSKISPRYLSSTPIETVPADAPKTKPKAASPAPVTPSAPAPSTLTFPATYGNSNTAIGINQSGFEKIKADMGRDHAMQYLRDGGVSWSESDNAGVNWMRAAMAAKKVWNGEVKPSPLSVTPASNVAAGVAANVKPQTRRAKKSAGSYSHRERWDIAEAIGKGTLTKSPISDDDKTALKGLVPNNQGGVTGTGGSYSVVTKNRDYQFKKLSDKHFECDVYEISNSKDTSRPIRTETYTFE